MGFSLSRLKVIHGTSAHIPEQVMWLYHSHVAVPCVFMHVP